jgi:hypothetical protein
LNEGAPTKRTSQITVCIAESISLGLTDEEAAAIADIPAPTLSQWRRIPEFAEALKKATAIRLRDRLKMINARVDNWPALGWLLERQYPTRWSKPELQISLNNSFNQTVNALSITISREEAKQIEEVAGATRVKVREMFAAYQPTLSHGNGRQSAALAVSSSDTGEKVVGPSIVRRDGEERSSAFWAQFASGSSDRIVEKATAIFVAKSVVDEVLGTGRGNPAIGAFKNEKPTVADVLAVIERLCGGPAGWQRLQKKAGF